MTRMTRWIALAVCSAVVLLGMTTAEALATGTMLCIPVKEGKPVKTPKAGACATGYTLTELGAEGKEGKEGKTGKEGPEGKQGIEGKPGAEGKSPFTAEETATLKAILPYVKYVGSGVGGKPTIQFSGVNVQVLSGGGKTEEVNGKGNLVIGYDESPGTQTGSNNLVLGISQTFKSFGGFLGGRSNASEGRYASVLGGERNRATGVASALSGGVDGTASGEDSSVSGGAENTASGYYSSVSGGKENKSTWFESSVSGGEDNTASGYFTSVTGGWKNLAEANISTIIGGKELKTKAEFEAIP